MNKLHIIFNRISAAITQQPSLKTNIVIDFQSLFYRHNRLLLLLMKHFPNNSFFRRMVQFNTKLYLHYYFKKVLSLPHYQTILDEQYNIICDALNRLQISISIDGINDISGWSIINADYASWFGMNKRISITSGTCYFAHVLCRCLQPFIIEQQTNSNLWNIVRWRMHRQFRGTIIGLLTNNHASAFSFLNLIPEDDSLLSGIEFFIILHEMGHAYIDSVEEFVWPFSSKPSPNIINEIKNDEEIMADIFAVHILHHIYLMDKNQLLLLFGPIFFFLIYSWLEDAKLIPTPKKHPLNSYRCCYIMKEVQHLHQGNEYQIYIDLLNKVWKENKEKICQQVNNMHKNRNKYTDILENVGKSMRNILDSISDKDL